MLHSEKTVKIYDVNKKLLGIGQLLSLSSGVIKVKGYDLPIIKSRTDIYIEIYSELQGVYPYHCKVSIATSNQLNALIIEAGSVIERRNSLKVKTNLSFNINSLNRMNEDITESVPNMKINMLNLSIGGMLISSNYELKIHDTMSFIFTFGQYEPVLLKAKVIRIDKVYDKITKELSAINYGCVFKKLSNYEESVVTKYLYDRQLQLYKNR